MMVVAPLVLFKRSGRLPLLVVQVGQGGRPLVVLEEYPAALAAGMLVLTLTVAPMRQVHAWVSLLLE